MPPSDVLGQEHAARRLRSAVRRQRIANAYLFHGPPGVGKAKMALEFAQRLCCEQPGDEPCGRCDSCRWIDAGSHPDVHILQPTPGKRYITVDQVRELNRLVFLYPMRGPWKIFILRDADDLRDDAQNMLLKTLEEPPADSVLILVTARPHRLLPTVLSRCQRVPFRALRPEQMRQILSTLPGQNEEDKLFAASYAQGSAADAQRALTADGRSLRDSLLEGMAQLRPATAFRIAGKIYATVQSSAAAKALEDQRETMRFHLDILTKLYRDVLVLSARADDVPLFNADQRPRLEEMARRMGWRAAAESAGLLLAARADIDRNANIRLALENALMGVAQRQPPLRD